MKSQSESLLIHVINHNEWFDRKTEVLILARSLKYKISATITFRRRKANRRLFTKGFITNLCDKVKFGNYSTLIIDQELLGAEITELEKLLKLKVVDRLGLILEVFSKRAKSNSGKLQISLANLIYQRSKLTKKWQHLERQRGGFGFLGGPGESQLEIDKRLIDKSITKIKSNLAKLDKRRDLASKLRHKKDFFSIALVGYTNAGKSSLIKRLTKQDTYISNKPFATLDPIHRRLYLENHKVIVFDTVGFINELPELLIESFNSTLKEILSADMIVNVRDICSKNFIFENDSVLEIVSKLFEKNQVSLPPIVDFINKCDKKPNLDHLLSLNNDRSKQIYGSALNDISIDLLKQKICQTIKENKKNNKSDNKPKVEPAWSVI